MGSTFVPWNINPDGRMVKFSMHLNETDGITLWISCSKRNISVGSRFSGRRLTDNPSRSNSSSSIIVTAQQSSNSQKKDICQGEALSIQNRLEKVLYFSRERLSRVFFIREFPTTFNLPYQRLIRNAHIGIDSAFNLT